MIDVEKLKKLHDDATPGPWEQESGYLGDDPYCSIYVTDADGEPQGLAEINDSIEAGQNNAELVTFFRNAVPAILALAEREKRMREALEPFAKIARHVEHTDKRDGEVVHRQYSEGQYHELRRDDFRRAAAAFNSALGEEKAS